MKIVVPGGTGQVGTILARAFYQGGHEVVVLSRRFARAPWRVISWDAKNLGQWAREIEGADAVINLAGRSVNCRYNSANRQAIRASRVDSTRIIGEAIARAVRPPLVWLQMSTATIYAHRYDASNDEGSGMVGGAEADAPDAWRFSIDVATAWEKVVDEADTPHTRKVKMRSAMVMSPDSQGIFDTLLQLVRFGLGGQAGNGQQYVSWIHYEDFVRAISWLIDKSDLAGAINLASPNPLTNAEFMRILRKAWGTRLGLPAAEWMLSIGALFLRTETELILKSRRVVPGRLLENGFEFQFASWSEAANDLCGKWRKLHNTQPTEELPPTADQRVP